MPTSTSDGGGLTVRTAAPGDYTAIWNLWVALQTLHTEAEPAIYRHPDNESAFQDYFKSVLLGGDWDALVAERNGEVVGYIVLREIKREPDLLHYARHWLEVEQLSVAKGARRIGVAAALLEQARLIARRRGIDHIQVGVRAFNPVAVEAYERLGFKHAFHHMSLRLGHGRED